MRVITTVAKTHLLCDSFQIKALTVLTFLHCFYYSVHKQSP